MELTFEPGASVSQIAQAHGVNTNQVFKWRRAFERGERNVALENIVKLAKALSVRPGELFADFS